MPDPFPTRYAFYLRPSHAMARAQAEVHDLLRRQYGLHVAAAFMPHATIKGFFRSAAPPAEIVACLDSALAKHRAFEAHNCGLLPWGQDAIVLDLQRLPGGADNTPLRDLHRAARAALLPLVHPTCEFTPTESHGDRFHAHLTLAMADIPAPFFPEIVAFLRAAEPIGPPSFPAEVYHLVEFTSDDWSGAWWNTLEWRLLHGWRLAP